RRSARRRLRGHRCLTSDARFNSAGNATLTPAWNASHDATQYASDDPARFFQLCKDLYAGLRGHDGGFNFVLLRIPQPAFLIERAKNTSKAGGGDDKDGPLPVQIKGADVREPPGRSDERRVGK